MENQMNQADKIDKFNFNETLGRKVRLINVAVDRQYQLMRDHEGVSLPRGQGPMVGYLAHHRDEVICQKDLERIFSISGATVSNMLNSLEKQGMIARVTSEADARRKRIVATEKAISRELLIHEEIMTVEKTMVEGFTPEEEAQLRSFLDRIAANLQEKNEQLKDKQEVQYVR